MAEDLATVDRERRELIATVSHELRTPLTAMTALLENLADGVVPADAAHLGEALGQAERLGALVADLLQLSRLEAGVVELERQPVHLRALADDCVAQVRSAGRTAAYDVAIPADLTVSADPARLRQLLVNALDNAGRHSPPDTPVLVTAGSGDAGWWLDVADAGPGVTPADRERVFERFGTDGAGGTGLGLAVARWVAQLHGGTLRFLDPPGGTGARLRLEVPRTPPGPSSSPVPSSPQEVAMTSRPTALAAVAEPRQPADRRGRALRPVLAGVGAGLWPAYGRGRRRGGSVRRSSPVVHRGRNLLDARPRRLRCSRAADRAPPP